MNYLRTSLAALMLSTVLLPAVALGATTTPTVTSTHVVASTTVSGTMQLPAKVPNGLGWLWQQFRDQVTVTFTFDPVKKAEKALQFAEERQAIAQKIIETSTDADAVARAKKMLEQSKRFIDKASERRDELAKNPDERSARLLRNLTLFEVHGNDVLDKIESKIPDNKKESFEAFREHAVERAEKLREAIDANETVPADVKERAEEVKKVLEDRKAMQDKFRADMKALVGNATSTTSTPALKAKIEALKKAHTEAIRTSAEELKQNPQLKGDATRAKQILERRREQIQKTMEHAQDVRDHREEESEHSGEGVTPPVRP